MIILSEFLDYGLVLLVTFYEFLRDILMLADLRMRDVMMDLKLGFIVAVIFIIIGMMFVGGRLCGRALRDGLLPILDIINTEIFIVNFLVPVLAGTRPRTTSTGRDEPSGQCTAGWKWAKSKAGYTKPGIQQCGPS